MQDIELIRYKWQQGVYDVEDMIDLVCKKIITKDQFFNITRYNFDGIVQVRKI